MQCGFNLFVVCLVDNLWLVTKLPPTSTAAQNYFVHHQHQLHLQCIFKTYTIITFVFVYLIINIASTS